MTERGPRMRMDDECNETRWECDRWEEIGESSGRREEEGKGKRHSMLYCLRNKSRDNGI